MNIFDWVNSVTLEKKDFDTFDEQDQKNYSQYMVNRFISMCDVYIPAINEINKYNQLTNKSHYDFCCNMLPKRKQYFKYIKKTKEIMKEDKSILME